MAALRLACCARGSLLAKTRATKVLANYASLVSPEALEDLYSFVERDICAFA